MIEHVDWEAFNEAGDLQGICERYKRRTGLLSGERNAVEGKFGEGKRFYGQGRVMTRLQGTSEVAIHMTFLVMNLQKRLRDLLSSIFRWLLTGKMPTRMAC